MNLSDLYKKEGDVAAPSATPPAGTSEEKVSGPSVAPAPDFESPPGLPQEYIDINLKNQAVPEILDVATVMQEERGLSFRRTSRESLCNATSIPYSPGRESKAVADRVAQGPRIFLSTVHKDLVESGLDEKKEEKARTQGPTIAHPDTLCPGTFIKGDSPAYRPG
jgi:hypothetical protein